MERKKLKIHGGIPGEGIKMKISKIAQHWANFIICNLSAI
jgi:hypothetical protein